MTHELYNQLKHLASKHPHKVAIVDDGSPVNQLTFSELLSHLDCKIKQLERLTTNPGQIYGVVDNKNIATVINIFAVLSLHGIYVPLSPHLPEKKWHTIISHAKIRAVLDDQSIQEFPPSDNVSHLASGYIIYTSGTTGDPKGVYIPYNRIEWLISALRKRIAFKQHIVGVTGPLTFDTSVKQLFQIIHGNTLVLIPEAMKLNTDLLREFIVQNKITILDMTPSLWDMHQLSHPLEHILLGGEAISDALWASIKHCLRTSNTRFYNLYGPTETTVDATVSLLDPDMPRPTLGEPLQDVEIDIQKGEILIHSPGIFSGYFNDHRATSEKICMRAGKRWYRTGDRGAWTFFKHQKHLLFQGRIDRQAKISGHRIELDEISQCLNTCDDIKQAHVMANNNQLVAFYVGNASKAALKKQLQRHLEAYKIPTHYMQMSALPLNKNGKICDDQLLKKYANWQRDEARHPEPLDTLTRLMALIQNILAVKSVRGGDNFFALGGDSISAMLLINELRKHRLHLNIQDIYHTPTVDDLNRCIQSHSPQKTFQSDRACLSFLPIHHRFFEMIQRDRHHWNQSVLIQVNQKHVCVEQLKKSAQFLVDNHPIFNLGVTSQETLEYAPPVKQSNVLSVYPSFDPQKIEKLQSQFDLKAGNLYAFAYFQREKLLFITCHHLLCDGLSIRLIVDKLFEYYHHETMVLEANTYLEWTQAINAMNTPLSSWYEQYLSQQSTCFLNMDNAGSLAGQMVTSRVILDKKQSQQVFVATNDYLQSGMNSVLLHALSITLGQVINQGSCWVDMESHGRCPTVPLDVSSTLGWFTAIYPVYLDCCETFDLAHLLNFMKTMEDIKPYHTAFGVLKYLRRAVPRTQVKNNHAIKFNFLGHFSSSHDSVAYVHQENTYDISSQCESPYPLEIEASVYNHALTLDFKFNATVFSPTTQASIVQRYQQALLDISECLIQSQLKLQHVLTPTPTARMMLKQEVKGAYIEQFLFQLNSKTSMTHITSTWQKIIAQHDALRCGFYCTNNGTIVQVIHQHSHSPFQTITVSSEAELEQFLVNDRRMGFTPETLQKTTSRYFMIELPKRRYFLWSHHHAILDGFSFNSIIHDWLSLIAGDPLPPRSNGYMEYLQKSRHIKHASFPQSLQKPVTVTKIKAAKQDNITHQESWISLGEHEISHLTNIANSYRSTLNHIFQLILAMAYRDTFEKKQNICLGSVIASRGLLPHEASVHEIIGNTLSILPLEIPCLLSDVCRDQLLNSLETVKQRNVALINHWQDDMDEIFALQTDETIYDIVLFFDNLKNHDFQKKLHHYFADFKTFEQVHFPLSVIINHHDQTSLGVEYCSLHFSPERMACFLKNIERSIQTILLLIPESAYEI